MNEQENPFIKELDRLFQEFFKAIEKGEIEKSGTIMNSIWIMHQIMVVSSTSTLKELTFLKTPVTFEDGGKYILSFMHIDGPKIKLESDMSGEGYIKEFEEVK